MAATPAADPDLLAAEERRLAQAAAAGDGNAFATLYERYEQRTYNLAYRITGSESDAADAVQEAFLGVLQRLPDLDGRELAFGSYVFTAARNASYDLIERRRRAQPSDSISDSAVPVGGGAGGLGLDPGDPEDDPSRRQLLESQRDEVRAANSRLPERQREVLALRELEELSYDEIAVTMEMNRNSVAQLISRARLNLRAELRGTALESIAGSSPDCERALPLIAQRDDGELNDAAEAAWLEAHLEICGGCRLGVEAMQEAGASYRAWAPIAAAPWLFKETMAKAAEAVGGDWSELAAQRSAARPEPEDLPGMPAAYLRGPKKGGVGRRRLLVAAGAVVAVLIVAALAASQSDDATRAPEPVVAEEGVGAAAALTPEPSAGKGEAREKNATADPVETAAEETAASAGGEPAQVPTRATSTPDPKSGEKQTSSPGRETRPDPQPKTATTEDQPTTQAPPPAPEPTVTGQPAPEEPPQRDPDPPREPPPPRPEDEKPIRTPPPSGPPGSGVPGAP
jgi:RNA polymerase sigma-70 factor (ECF subfamily)